MSTKSTASAILAVYNAAPTIELALDSLLAQSFPVEIIVVDDGSTDATPKILRKYRGKIRVIRQKHQGPAVARNLGASFAKGKILLFVDSDMVFEKHYVRDLTAPLRSTIHDLRSPIGTYTTEERVGNWDNVWARCWNYAEGWEDKKRFKPNPPQWGTDFRAILTSEFKRVGGFDNVGYTDTWTLYQKLGARPLATRAVCYHRNPGTVGAVYRQAKWAAKRPYKLGFVGTLAALFRVSFPVSIVAGLITSLRRAAPAYLIFRLVYDWGRFVGIVELLTTNSKIK